MLSINVTVRLNILIISDPRFYITQPGGTENPKSESEIRVRLRLLTIDPLEKTALIEFSNLGIIDKIRRISLRMRGR